MNRRRALLRYVTFIAVATASVLAAVYAPPPSPTDAQGIWTHPSPTPHTPRWRIHIRAFPDGVGAGGQRCQGCDGSFTGADQFVAAGRPLKDVNVVVLGYKRHEAGGQVDWEEVELWRGDVAQPNSRHPETDYTIVLDEPPPYTVYLDKNPDGYALCPTAPQWRTFEPQDFQSPGGRPGANRQVELTWFFWSCAGEALGQDLPNQERYLGGVICGIYCWLGRADPRTPRPGETPRDSCGIATPTCPNETPTPTP